MGSLTPCGRAPPTRAATPDPRFATGGPAGGGVTAAEDELVDAEGTSSDAVGSACRAWLVGVFTLVSGSALLSRPASTKAPAAVQNLWVTSSHRPRGPWLWPVWFGWRWSMTYSTPR